MPKMAPERRTEVFLTKAATGSPVKAREYTHFGVLDKVVSVRI